MAAIPDSSLPGHKQLHDRVCGALDLCQESQDIEFKKSGTWEELKIHIARTSMAMANLRDGGVLIIGIGEERGTWRLDGISRANLSTYDEDNANDFINRYASPPLRVELVIVEHRGKTVLAVKVPEFGDTPIVCKRNGPDGSNIREGDIYVRPRGKPQTTRVVTAQDLHDLLDLAAEKRAQKLLAAAHRVGMQPPAPAREAFDRELGGL